MKNYYADNLYYTTTALCREVSSIAENAFIDLGLTPSDAYLIMVVNEKPNIQPTEISEKILLAPSTITRMIEKLEKRNIVVRTTEGKYTFVAPTPKGRDLYINIISTWDNVNQTYQSRLSNDTVGSLVEIASGAVLKLR